ncbi:MAG TPA: hypothetical protein VK824_09635 [Planctomycetota bacterium]|nr:hypothetical protein [Planctomycetota bacterium]
MKLARLVPLCLSALLGLGALVSAQGGGFHAGELFVYTGGLTSPGYTGPGILRVDPVSGASSVFVPLWSTLDDVGAMAFDPYRQRLVFGAALAGVDPSPVMYLWLADGSGQLVNLTKDTLPAVQFSALAPAKDGRIYCRTTHDTTKPFRFLDASNQLRVLYASDGVTPMAIDGNANYLVNGMIYDAATNALFIASTTPAPGFPLAAVNVRKLPLSADGSRVIGPVGNATFEISPNPPDQSSWETPRGWSYGPGGKLVLNILCIDDEVLPRLLLVDPVTSAISVWASDGEEQPATGLGWSTTTGAAYTTALNKVVVADYWNIKLRAYAQGATGGPGTVIATSPAAVNGNGYYVNVTAVPPDACSGGWIAYGTGLAGKGGIVPKLTGGGCAEPGAPITLAVSDAVGGASAMLFIGLAKVALPFKGGTFHVGTLLLSAGLPLGGAPGAVGAGSFSLPTSLPAIPSLTGASLFLQAGIGDAAAAHGVALTQGLELEIG